jgi:acetyl-CoA synthetase
VTSSEGHSRFRLARDALLAGPRRAAAEFAWPDLTTFNWALDWFDHIAQDNHAPALVVATGTGTTTTSFAELASRSDAVAGALRALGVGRGDLLLVALGNRTELWEVLLAAMKLGAVVVPTYPTATAPELADRVRRARVAHAVAEHRLTDRIGVPGARLCVGGDAPGWTTVDSAVTGAIAFRPDGVTHATDPLFYYFTSGTTARPKIVVHTHASYPAGHLTSMFWNGVRPGDRHLNLAAPGWAKHAWSSLFVPWNAEATVVAVADQDPALVLDTLTRQRVTSLCAPPSTWRALIRHGLGTPPPDLREVTSAGEQLGADITGAVLADWGLRVRDGYGQTEMTCLFGDLPGRRGAVLPGYRVSLVDPETGHPADGQGELCLDLTERPLGLMAGYLQDDGTLAPPGDGVRYRTGDLARRLPDGRLELLGRADDMFKSFDHRISPLELETVLRAHDAVAEAAVVPTAHPVGGNVATAYLLPSAGCRPGRALADAVFAHVLATLPPEKSVRRLAFVPELPRTASGKVQRSVLRASPPAAEHYEPLA